MQKKNVYLTQFNNATERNLIPLAIGLLSSYIKNNAEIKNAYNIELKILRDEPEKLLKEYKEPYILAFSNYFWNHHFTLEIARLAKERYPNVLIIFGGPSVPIDEKEVIEFFRSYPFVDIIVPGEGEVIFSEILITLNQNEKIENIKGISLNQKGNIFFQNKRKPLDNFLDFPSPFLDGTFDEILHQYPDDITGVVWESNRGCPYSCSFCYWGGPEKRITDFSNERIYKELDWIAKNKINYIFGADANFGIRERDEDIARYIANLNIKTGYPKFLVINWNKNSTDKIFDIVDALNTSDVSFMLTVSVQSFHLPTLEAVDRKNIKMEHFNNILAQAHQRNFNTYTEIILGLPQETYSTFIAGLDKVMIPNLNYHFNLYPCVLITGTAMNTKEYREKYSIQSRRCEINLAKTTTKENSFREYEDIIVATSTMPSQDWQKSYIIGFLIKSLYGFRLVYFIFNYLRDTYNISLVEMFEFMISQSDKFTSIKECICILKQISDSILNNGKETIKLKHVETSLYPEMAVLINILTKKNAFYIDLKNIIIDYLTNKKYTIEDSILNELIAYQKLIIPSFNGVKTVDFTFYNNEVIKYLSIINNKITFIDSEFTTNIDQFLVNHIYGGMIFKLNITKEAI